MKRLEMSVEKERYYYEEPKGNSNVILDIKIYIHQRRYTDGK